MRWWHPRKYAGPCYVNQANLMILDFVSSFPVLVTVYIHLGTSFSVGSLHQVFLYMPQHGLYYTHSKSVSNFKTFLRSWLKLWKSVQVSLIEIIKLQESLEHTNEPDIYVHIYIYIYRCEYEGGYVLECLVQFGLVWLFFFLLQFFSIRAKKIFLFSLHVTVIYTRCYFNDTKSERLSTNSLGHKCETIFS